VASILVIAEFTIPLLAVMGLKRIVDKPDLLRKNMKWVYTSFLLTAGVCVLFALMPGLFFSNFVSGAELEAFKSIPAEYYSRLVANVTTMRQAMFTADCWRSVAIIVVGTLLLLLFKARKLNATYTVLAIAALCLIDMWQVNKRYLNDSMFEAPRVAQSIQKTDIDNYITARSGEGRDYRVLNLAVSTFNDNTTSFFYSSVGGYHAAKLRRYQELVEEHIAAEVPKIYETLSQAPLDSASLLSGPGYPAYNLKAAGGETKYPVINMLNTRWFILAGQNGVRFPIENNAAFGNAWFVNNVKYVDNANEEIDALHTENPRHTAVIDRQFESALDGCQFNAAAADSTRTIRQTRLISDEVDYDVNSQHGGLVVFSEIYYPGWTATIDGKPATIVRADYVLRAMYVPAGKHQIHMEFHPQTVKTTETIATVAFYVLLLIIAAAAFVGWKKKK